MNRAHLTMSQAAKRETGACSPPTGLRLQVLAVIAGLASSTDAATQATIAEHGYSRIVLDSLPAAIAEAD
jgi:hypothetical protein